MNLRDALNKLAGKDDADRLRDYLGILPPTIEPFAGKKLFHDATDYEGDILEKAILKILPKLSSQCSSFKPSEMVFEQTPSGVYVTFIYYDHLDDDVTFGFSIDSYVVGEIYTKIKELVASGKVKEEFREHILE